MAQNNLFALDWLARRHPLTVTPEMPLMDVIKLMSRDWDSSCRLSCGVNRLEDDEQDDFITSTQESCALGVSNSQLEGIFTESDLVASIATRPNLSQLRLSDVMNRNVIAIAQSQLSDLTGMIKILYQNHIAHLPVIDQAKRFLGLITQDSLYQALVCTNLLESYRVAEVMSDQIIYAPPHASLLEIAQLMCEYGVSCIPIATPAKSSPSAEIEPVGIVTQRNIVQLWLLELDLKQLQAHQAAEIAPPWLLVNPEDSLSRVHQQMQQHQVGQLLVVGEAEELVGLVTQRHLLPVLSSVDLSDTTLSNKQVHQWEQQRLKYLEKRNLELQQQLQKQARAFTQQAEQERLVAAIALRIRQSLNLEEVLNATVFEVRQLLDCDRVLIYTFEPDWSGIVTNESTSEARWSILDRVIKDPCFEENWLKRYRQGHVNAIANIYQCQLNPCYLELLESFDVRANLAIPIIIRDQTQLAADSNSSSAQAKAESERLWGLLIAHNCSTPRTWPSSEINLLQQLSVQVAIAIQQAELYQHSQRELYQRQQAEQKIYQQAALIDITTDAILVRDLDNRILFWNRGAERLYGWKADLALGQSSESLFQAEAAEMEQAIKTVVEQGEWRGELHKVTKFGKAIIVESHWTLVRDSNGKPKSILTVDSDITEKKQLEAQFLRTQRLESLGSLAGGIAHDLNNILTPIMMSVQLLPCTLPAIDERSQQIIEMLDNNVKRGAALVQQVLSFSRGIEGEHKILQVRHLLFELKQMMAETFPKSIKLEADIPRNLWTIFGDATQIHQVFLNLVVNARDAMPDGGIIQISAENLWISQTYAQIHAVIPGAYIVVTVADTGIGMTPEILERIFEPFFTTKQAEQGTGLGLATVDNIVKSHGGFIDVSSRVGEGTQFKVFFPATETSETEAMDQNPELLQGSQELVLAIDDEKTICEITKASLETHNYQVITANDGVEAIALYVQHQQEIDVVLVNMMMPSMDGITAIRTLQRINPRVKIIAVSGLTSNHQLLEVRQIKVNAFLAKPYTTEKLLKTLHEVIEEGRGSSK